MHPPVLNLKREEHSAGLKRTANFGKCAILKLAGTQMMKHENRNHGRKAPVRERQPCRVALNYGRIRAVHPRTELRRKRLIVLETRHTASEAPQLFRRRSWPRAQLQHVFAQFGSLQNPRQKLPPRHPSPHPRSTKPCFVSVHELVFPIGNRRILILDDSRITMFPPSRSPLMAGRFLKSSVSRELVFRVTRLNRITDGRFNSRAAIKSAKSMSEEMMIRSSSSALARTSASGAAQSLADGQHRVPLAEAPQQGVVKVRCQRGIARLLDDRQFTFPDSLGGIA
jgi:hypothetical protein